MKKENEMNLNETQMTENPGCEELSEDALADAAGGAGMSPATVCIRCRRQLSIAERQRIGTSGEALCTACHYMKTTISHTFR